MKFFKNNIPVFVLLPFLILLGNIHALIGSVFLALVMIVWALREKNDWLLLIFCCIIILGDNRFVFLSSFKTYRYIGLSILFLKTLLDVLKGVYKFNRLIYISFPFFFVALLGVFLSPVPIDAFTRAVAYFFLVFVCLCFLPYYMTKNRNRILQNFLYLTLTVYAAGLVFAVLDPGFAYLLGRYRGIFGNPNGLGIFSTIMLPFTFMMMNKFPQYRKIGILILVLGLISILLAESRTALGTILLFFFLHIIYRGGKRRKRLFWFLILPGIIFFLTVISLEQIVAYVGLEDFLRVESIKTGTGRFMAWGLGLVEIQKNLWIGRGFGYESHYFYSLREFFLQLEHQGGMHNSFLTFLMNNGILGLIPFLTFIFVLIGKIRASEFGVPFVIITLISANFESWLNASLSAFTFFFYMVIVFMINYKKIHPLT